MNRITEKDLEAVCKRINIVTNSPLTPYTKIGDRYEPQALCYHLSHAYGGVALHRMSGNKGCTGVTDVFSGGHGTKRELYDRMHAFLRGFESANEVQS